MEHFFWLFKTSASLRAAFAFVCLAMLAGCEKPLDNPESVDKIYQDLNSEKARYDKDAIEEGKKLQESIKDIEKAKSGDPLVKRSYKEKYDHERKKAQAKQMANYYKLRAESRLDYIKRNYPNYYSQKKPWPDQEEFKQYQDSKKLTTASRDWNQRVPKLFKPPSDPKKEKKGEGEGEKSGEKKEEKKEGGHH